MNRNIYYIDIDYFVDNFMPGMMQTMDVSIKNGDFETGNTDEQEIFFILQSSKGNFYYEPKIGYNINSKLNASINKTEERKEIRAELENDGFTVDEINLITVNDINRISDSTVKSLLMDNKALFNIKASRK